MAQAHYDLSDEFFRLFQDPTQTYSCAYFERELPSIDVADALLDEHRELTEWATTSGTSGIFTISDLSSAEAFTLPSTNRPVWRVGRRRWLPAAMCEDRQMINVDLPHTEGIPEIVRSFAA